MTSACCNLLSGKLQNLFFESCALFNPTARESILLTAFLGVRAIAPEHAFDG
jgi:hypothetical protein